MELRNKLINFVQIVASLINSDILIQHWDYGMDK